MIHRRALTGDRPTGYLHLGHYVASLRQRVSLQEQGVETFVLIADYQVITDRESVGSLRDFVLSSVAEHLALGIDPARSVIFTHSAVPTLNQLVLPFLSLVSTAELERNPTVKDELALSGRGMSGLLLTYPVHQAADILFCHADVVPVGRDQLPHIEQTRVIARRFNQRYGPVFQLPLPLLSSVPHLLGLDGAKMSKSRGNTVELRATTDETSALIRSARTDAVRAVTYDPVNRPEVASLLQLASSFLPSSPEEIASQVDGAAALKTLVVEAVNEELAAFRARRSSFLSDEGYLLEVLRAGNERANEIASQTLGEVRAATGMAYDGAGCPS